MNQVSRTEDVDLGLDLGFEQRWWRVQHWVWGFSLVLLLGGIAGIFGRGPLSTTTAHAPGGALHVDYERLARFGTPAVLTVHLDRRLLQSGLVRVSLNTALVQDLQLQRVIPQPQTAELMGDGVRYTFVVDPAQDSATVRFMQQASAMGMLHGSVIVNEEPPLTFRQFVFP